ncbi:MAG: glycosyltransferase family 9 protein [Desulfuromonadaceae bacterium]
MLPKASAPDRFSARQLLLIRPGGIGDAVLLIPVIHSLRSAFPSCTIDILAESRNADVFVLTTGVRSVYKYDNRLELITVLLNTYDVVIDTEQWHRLSAVVARLVRAPVKIGFDTNERRRMFTHDISYDLRAYELDNFASLLKPLGVNFQHDVETVTLKSPPQSVIKASQLLRPNISEPFIVIFPGASIPEKRWGADRFRSVVEMLSAFGVKIVVVGGKEDRQQGEVITAGGLGLNLAGVTSLSETAAVIQKGALLLSGDSGVLHIAVGLGVPTVSLFGPGSVKKWAPQGERHIVINKGLPCSPCTAFGNTPPCSHDTRCMREITVDEVVNAVTMLLTSLGAMPSRCCKQDWIEAR